MYTRVYGILYVFMFLGTCVCIYMDVYMYYVRMGLCMYLIICVCMYVCIYAFMYICVCTFICTCVYMYVCTHTVLNVCTYLRMYARVKYICMYVGR